MTIDPVFMPNSIEVQKFSISNKAFHTKCSTKGLPKMNVTYVSQLYTTILNSTSTLVNIQPPKNKIQHGMFMECLYEAEEGLCAAIAKEREREEREEREESEESGGSSSSSSDRRKEVEVDALGESDSQSSQSSQSRQSRRPQHAIIMLQYKRGRILEQVLGDISKQTTNSDVYIWNNNVNGKIRYVVVVLLLFLDRP